MENKEFGRIIIKQIVITQNEEVKDGAFVAFSKVEKQLRKEGFIIGSMCGDSPIGFAREDKYNYIAKWRNILEEDYQLLSGIVTVDDLKGTRHGFRDGHIIINYFKEE